MNFWSAGSRKGKGMANSQDGSESLHVAKQAPVWAHQYHV